MKKFVSILLIITMILASGCGGGAAGESLDELLSLGQKYLLEENYKEAIVAFEKAIKIDGKCVDAYLGLADAYTGLGDMDKAIAALEQGLDQLPDNTELIAALNALTNSESESEQDSTAEMRHVDGLISNVRWDGFGLSWDIPADDTMIKSCQVYYRRADAPDGAAWIHSPHRGHFRPPDGYGGIGGIHIYGIAGGSHEEGYIPPGEYVFKVVAEAVVENHSVISEEIYSVPLRITREPETVIFRSITYDRGTGILTVQGTLPDRDMYFELYDGDRNTYNDWLDSSTPGIAYAEIDRETGESEIVGKRMILVCGSYGNGGTSPAINITTADSASIVVTN